MKKFFPYIVVIIVLAVAVVWFIKNQSKGTINEREGNFAVKDKNEISKVILTETDKQPIEISSANGMWMVNGKYAAREDMIESLLTVATRVTSLCPVPAAAHDNVIRELMTHHVRVEFFDKNNATIKSYWVGGPTTDGQNTYMLLENEGQPASRPHLTYIPGFKGFLTPRYNAEEETWRTRAVFNYTEAEIKSLQVEYSNDEKKSFAISKNLDDSFTVSPINEKFRINDSYQQKYICQYLGFYSSIYLEAFANDLPNRDSIIKTTPYCTITITETDSTINTVKLFRMPVNKRSKMQFDANGNPMAYDIDHFFASLHQDKDLALVQYYTFGTLLRDYKDFFFKPTATK